MAKITVACAALTGTIYAGRINKAGNAFLDGKQDVTSDVLKAIIEKVKPGHAVFVNVDGEPKFKLEVTEVSAASLCESLPADCGVVAPSSMMFTSEDFIASIREMYEEWQTMKKDIEAETVSLPDFEYAIDYFARHGMEPIDEEA